MQQNERFEVFTELESRIPIFWDLTLLIHARGYDVSKEFMSSKFSFSCFLKH
jgi:hypothetical protein